MLISHSEAKKTHIYISGKLMKLHRRHSFRLTVSDASRLRKVAQLTLPAWQWGILALALIIILFGIFWCILAFTPARRLVPGYPRRDARATAMENIMRLDSLQRAYEQNQAFLKNISTIFNTDRIPTDSAALTPNPTPMNVDSLMKRSREETLFIKMMDEREKYNISILAPLAAEGMMFTPLCEEAVVTDASRGSRVAIVAVTADKPVGSVAEGTVLDTYFSPADGGYVVITQHAKGFVSRIGRLGAPLVERGDKVESGQIIAFPSAGKGKIGTLVSLEMWRNGDPLIPAELLQPEISRR